MGEYFFGLSEEQAILQDAARKFARSEILPRAAALDESADFPADLIRDAAKLGLQNLLMPGDLGGSELSSLAAVLVIEELAYACAGVTTSIVVNDLALLPILFGATPEQRKSFIEPIVSKQKLASFCLTEPGAGSDVAGMQSRLEKVDGGYTLNGAKQWITNGGKADQFTVFATLDPALKHKGICCVVVPSDAKGVSTGHHENKLGQRCSNTVSVHFENVFVPESALIGGEGSGFKLAMKTLDASRPMTAAIAVGIAQRAYDEAVAYAKERKQFGTPIAGFQAIQFMLADAITEIEAARLLTYRSSWVHDQGQRNSLESSMAKRFAADCAMKITTDAVQIFGGYGYTKEYPVEKLMRDAKLMQIYEGTSQIQRLVIARDILQ